MKADSRNGFAILEILAGIILLAAAFTGFNAYQSFQRKGVFRSGQISDATQIGVTYVEMVKGLLADSAKFDDVYGVPKEGLGIGAMEEERNGMKYKVDFRVSRGASANNLLQVKVIVTWGEYDRIDLGVLVMERI